MVQLTDYSDLRAPADATVTIPLNGVNYHAIPEAPADLILDAAASKDTDNLPTLPEGMTLDQMAEADPSGAMKLGKAGASSLTRALDFLEEVLEPDSWAQWRANMARPGKGLSPGERKKHLARMITLPQMLAVFKELVKHYAGRPTTPSAPSPNGAGGIGTTSTDGAPAEA